MAHFAKLDENDIVEKVVVVGNDVPTAAGPLGENDMHSDGESYCQNLFKGGVWKQTSYNNNFRKQYAGVGDTYDSVKDKFIRPQPYPSWTLNADDDWEAPVAYPTVQNVNENIQLPVKEWSEDDQTWKSTGTDSNNYLWNSATSSWDLA
tara:strand:+ start:1632 stop:2078 length:447 start_codon:yes stop_codon:yes gene_type:complete